jgi:hypothetical protein
MSRKIEFIGEITRDNISIESNENVYFITDGICNLSGEIIAQDNTIEMWVNGKNNLKFSGKCKKLLLRNVYGKSVIDFKDFICSEASIEYAEGQSTIILSVKEKLNKIHLSGETILYLNNSPQINNLSLLGKSRIEHIINIETNS